MGEVGKQSSGGPRPTRDAPGPLPAPAGRWRGNQYISAAAAGRAASLHSAFLPSLASSVVSAKPKAPDLVELRGLCTKYLLCSIACHDTIPKRESSCFISLCCNTIAIDCSPTTNPIFHPVSAHSSQTVFPRATGRPFPKVHDLDTSTRLRPSLSARGRDRGHEAPPPPWCSETTSSPSSSSSSSPSWRSSPLASGSWCIRRGET